MRAKHFLVVMSFLFVSTAMVQAQSSWSARNYDPSTETTVKGTVEQVKQVSGRRGWNGTRAFFVYHQPGFLVRQRG